MVEIQERETWVYKNKQALASLERGLENAAQGKVRKLDLSTLHEVDNTRSGSSKWSKMLRFCCGSIFFVAYEHNLGHLKKNCPGKIEITLSLLSTTPIISNSVFGLAIQPYR